MHSVCAASALRHWAKYCGRGLCVQMMTETAIGSVGIERVQLQDCEDTTGAITITFLYGS